MYPFPFANGVVLKIIDTNETVIAIADELDGVVAVRTRVGDVLLVRHADLRPGRKVPTKEQYDLTSIPMVTEEVWPECL